MPAVKLKALAVTKMIHPQFAFIILHYLVIFANCVPRQTNGALYFLGFDDENAETRTSNGVNQEQDPEFDHEYKATANITLTRHRRDGGLVSGPVATAIVTGMIGMTAKAVQDITAYHPYPSQGGCGWFGTSPFCNYHCPSDYDFIREHNGRCSYMWLAGFCIPDPSFGEACSTLLGRKFVKRFCCKSDPNECSWSGRWMGAFSAYNAYCRYDNAVGRCGQLACSINHYDFKAHNESAITGEHCDRVDLFGFHGRASCGYIAFFDDDNNLRESWYKTSGRGNR